MLVECFVCGREFEIGEGVGRTRVQDAQGVSYRFYCSARCAEPYLGELISMSATDELIRRARLEGDEEEAEKWERRKSERGWAAPDVPPDADHHIERDEAGDDAP